MISQNSKDRLDFIHRIQNHLTKKFQVFSGKDSNGKEYDDIEEMWRYESFLGDDESNDPQWYNKSHTYWETEENVQATIDGMLGGFSVLSDRDLAASRNFTNELLDNMPSLKRRIEGGDSTSCECGAGIGRLTKGLILPLGLSHCHLVETSPRLINAAPEYIGKDRVKCNFICDNLQNFEPESGTYDIIWVQWVIGYLTDWDLCNFFNRMGKSLRKGGVVVVKDNICNDLAFMSDKDDSDITRSFQYLMAILKESGLKVVKAEDGKDLIRWQDDFPDDIWPVPMIALTM